MKFRVERIPFLNEISKVSRAVSGKTPLPSLSGIKIEAKDNTLFFTGSDSDISMYSYLKSENNNFVLEIEEEGAIVLGSRYICDIVRKLESDQVSVEIIDGQLTRISDDYSDFKINGLKASDYPTIDFTKPEKSILINGYTLQGCINQTIFATSDKETRPVLTGINVKASKGSMEFVGTDSYRLAKKIISINEETTFGVTIPAKTLVEISKTIENDDILDLAVNDKKIQCWIGNTIIQSRLIEGAYPETSRLIPQSFDYELTADAHDLLNAIDRASLMKEDGKNIVKLSMSENKVELSSKSQQVGSVKEILNEAAFQGNNLEISFSGKYAYDAIRAIDSDLVKIKFSGEMKPFIITGNNDDSCIQLILPVRTYA